MVQDTTPKRTKASSGSGWTDAQKVALLLSIIETQGGIDWKKVQLPEGRTQKACVHVIGKLRETLAKEAISTPTKANNNSKKRKAAVSDDDEEDEEISSHGPVMKKAKMEDTKHMIKTEDDNDDDE